MAEAFLTEKQRANRLAAYNKRRNPAPGRSKTEYSRIRRSLQRIAGCISEWLIKTDYEPVPGWLPYKGIVTTRDDDYLQDFYAAYSAESDIDDDGYLVAYHDPGIKATNRITAVTWYKNDQGGEFLLAKNIYSPIPCAEWGRLPITLAHWRIIAEPLISAAILWQWTHAVRDYLGDDSFAPGGFMGWHLQECSSVISRAELRDGPGYMFDAEHVTEDELIKDQYGWIGHIIYKHIIDEYLKLADGR